MIGLVAYLALVVTLPALVLGHQGEDFPPLRWWRWARARQGRRTLSVRFSRPLRRPAALASNETLPAPPVPVPALPPSWAYTDTEEAA